MILIFSSKDDYTTNIVCRWLNFYNQKFLRLNKEDRNVYVKKIDMENQEFILEINHVELNLNCIKAVWYRRGGFPFNLNNKEKFSDSEFLLQSGYALSNLISREYNSLAIFLQKKIEKNRSIGSFFNSDLNKFEILELAKKLNFDIPETFIFTKKTDLRDLHNKRNIITKAISDGLYYFANEHAYYTYTELIKKETLDKLPNEFHISLFQTKIEKKYEIRSFYLLGKFYSMAIFSQSNKKTDVDFRKYDYENPNKCVPFKIPVEIERKLEDLFQLIKLNTGSVDLIIDNENNFYFLEINPIGQFTMTSRPCNYQLEKIMALELIKIKNEGKNKKIAN